MKIRRLEEKDVSVLAEMEKRCFIDPWTEEMLSDCLRYPYYYGLIAEEGGQVCGYCVLIVLFEDGEIANIAVDIPYRGRGIAKALMDYAHGLAKSLGAERCLLEVRQSNAAAISLYQGFGYEEYGVRERYYPDGENARLMRKEF